MRIFRKRERGKKGEGLLFLPLVRQKKNVDDFLLLSVEKTTTSLQRMERRRRGKESSARENKGRRGGRLRPARPVTRGSLFSILS